MAHQPEIWTGEVRRVLYARLVRQFGPSIKWKKASSPGRGLDEEFEKFCEAFAHAMGAKSGDAVRHQIRFALPETEHGSTWGRHAQTAILNKAAALETGFITDSQLPNLTAVGRLPKKEAKGSKP
jgi:hypothetical protein